MSNFSNTIKKNGLKYYIFPSGLGLFKATKNYDKSGSFFLNPSGSYFFGFKNMSPDYIDAYEKEYGIIFEFLTTREYKLLALDDHETQERIYQKAPKNIKRILDINYGHLTGTRTSDNEPDRELSLYLCSKGFEGYAIHDMNTDFGGKFHDELMLCDMDGIQYVGKITTDEKVDIILEKERIKKLSVNPSRKKKDFSFISETAKPKNLFLDEEDDGETSFSRKLFGGKRRRYTRKSKNKKRTHKNKSFKKHK
jgi:hypothetical protein